MKRILFILVVALISVIPFAHAGTTYNVKSTCGAVGNGVADDTTAIQTCLNDVTSGNGDTVLCPSGTYKITGALTINKSNWTWDGSSNACTLSDTRTSAGAIGFQVGQNGIGSGNAALGGAIALNATVNEGAITFTTVSSLGASVGSYVYLSQGGIDYSTDTAPGHPLNCDLSGCRGELVKLSAANNGTFTYSVTTMLHDTYNPSVNGAVAQLVSGMLTSVTIKDTNFNGNGGANSGVTYGLMVNDTADSTISGVLSKNTQGSALIGSVNYNTAWNNDSVTGAGSEHCGSGYQTEIQGNLIINTMTISSLTVGAPNTGCLGDGAFGWEVDTAANLSVTSLHIDAAGTTGGRPFKVTAVRWSTFNDLISKNGACCFNGMVFNYYSAHNVFNSCTVTGNGNNGAMGNGQGGINTFGNFNQYNTFNNCIVKDNGNVQLIQGYADALTLGIDSFMSIRGGTYSAPSGGSTNPIVFLTATGALVTGTSEDGTGHAATGIFLQGASGAGTGATIGCVNSNTMVAASGLAHGINVSFASDIGASNTLNGFSSNLNAGSCPGTAGVYGSGPSAWSTAGVSNYSPSSLAFGNQTLNSASSPLTTTLTNDGTNSATFIAAYFASTGTSTGTNFAIQTNNFSTLNAGNNTTILLTFTPVGLGALSDTLYVVDTMNGAMQAIPLTGTGVNPATSYSPTALVFGNQAQTTTSAPQTVTLTNTGAGNLITTGITLTGTNPSDFAISGGTCNPSGQTIAPSGSCTVFVTFTPAAVASYTANLHFVSNAPTSPDNVGLSGAGIAGSQTATPVLSPSSGIVPQVVTATSASGGTIIECWSAAPTTPVTNGLGTGCNVGTQLTNGGTIVVSAATTLNVVAGTSTLLDSAVANGVYTGTSLVPGAYSPLAIAWQAPLSTDTTHFNTFVLSVLPNLSGIGGSSSTATQNNLGNVYWSDIDDCSTTAPCAAEPNYDWTNIDTQLSAYIAATVGSNGTFANGCAGGTACKIIIRIAPQQDSGNSVTKTPTYVMSHAYAQSLGVADQDVAFCTAWPGFQNNPGGTWPGTIPATNLNTGNDAVVCNATSCSAYGGATAGTPVGPPDANQNLSGFPVVYEVPIMTAYQKFITAIFLHYSASGTAPGPTIAPYISSIAIGMAAGSENNPGCVGAGGPTNPVPGPGGVLTHTFWPGPKGLAAEPAGFTQCGYLTTWNATSVNGISCTDTHTGAPDGDGYVTAMDKFFATLNTNGITISQSSHGGPPSNQNTFNVPGTAPYADAEALLASQYNTGFGQQSERLLDIVNYAAVPQLATTQNWVVNFARFKAPVHHLITINDGGANPHAAEFGISSIGSCSAGVCTVNCSGSNGNSCEVFGDGATILITNNANANYNGMQVIDCSGACPAGKIKIDTADASGGAGGQLWSPSYLPLLLPFASQHQASYVGVWECDLDYTYGTTTANFTSPCGGNPGPDTAWQNAIINFENGTPTSTSAIKGTAACKGKCAAF